MKLKVFLVFILVLCTFSCFLRKDKGGMRLNYLEYKRGKSFNNQTNLQISYNATNLLFEDILLTDESFFPDNFILPSAFLKPLFQLRISDAVKAFTEPYYSFRFIHFLKKNPKIGVGLEFIHVKVFFRDYNQKVRMSGTLKDNPVNQSVTLKDYFKNFNVSHGVNHTALYLEYREMFYKTNKIKDGRLQTFINCSIGITVPHLETVFKIDNEEQQEAYSYQAGLKNLGFAFGLGLRYRPFRSVGFIFEYKYTYSLLNDMRFDTIDNSDLKMSFGTSQLTWGLSLIF